MMLGLIPAIIAVVVLAAALIPLVLSMPSLSVWLTPFAEGWFEPWRGLLRAAVGLVIVAAALALASVVFSALTLTIGDPFYQRIWHAVEVDLGEAPPADGGSFWTTLGEGLRLILLGLLIAILVLLIGLIPAVGGFLAPSPVWCSPVGCSPASSRGAPSTRASSARPIAPPCSRAAGRGSSVSASRPSSAS